MRALSVVAFALLLLPSSGCVVQETRPLPPPMSQREAADRGQHWCTEHGYGCRLRQVTQRGDLVEVLLEAEGHGARGPLRLEYGLYDHRLVRVEAPLRG